MKKIILLFALFLALSGLNAQVVLAKLTGKDSKDFKIGYGAFLKFGYPVSEAADVSLEAGILFWFFNDGSGDGMAVVPVKAGYRYTLNGTGTGFYVEPQLGYNAYGVISNTKFNGFIWSAGTGYLFGSSGAFQFDLGIRYESIVKKGGPVNYISLRLAKNFSFGRRE